MKDFRAGFYEGTDRARAGTMVQDRPTRPFVDVIDKNMQNMSILLDWLTCMAL